MVPSAIDFGMANRFGSGTEMRGALLIVSGRGPPPVICGGTMAYRKQGGVLRM